jgi:hypothetical protein
MVAKLCAALLVALCILPNTAPFQTLVLADFTTGQRADAGTLTTHTSVTDPDDNDALVLERSHVSRQARLCALTVVASCDAAAVFAVFRPAVAPPTFILDLSRLKTVLRL